jgi:hypothetical protein
MQSRSFSGWPMRAGFFLHNRPLYIVTSVGLVVSASLLAVGIRQRSGRPVPFALLGIPAGLAIVATAIALSPTGSQAMQGMIIPVYVGVLMLISAVSLWPRERSFTAPERAFFAILILFAIGQGGLGASAAMIHGPDEGKELYRAILGLFMPTIYVGTGVAAVLVVAGDLAEKLRVQVSHDPLRNGGSLKARSFRECSLAPSRRSSSTVSMPMRRCSLIARS